MPRTTQAPKRFRNFFATIFHATEEEIETMKTFAENKALYAICGREACPETGREHLHAAVVLNNGMSLEAIHKKFCGRHIDDLKAPLKNMDPNSNKNAFAYCGKGIQPHEEWTRLGTDGDSYGIDKDIVFEIGDVPAIGVRSDLTAAREAIIQCKTWSQVLANEDIQDTVCRNMAWCKEVFANRPIQPMPAPVWRTWQQEVLDKLETDPDARSILWIYDPVGAAGKTTLTNFLVRNHGAISLNGRAADMLYAYDNQEIVVIDLPRSSMQDGKFFCPYGAIEKIKDGVYFSGKYASSQRVRDFNVHVIVTSNSLPEEGRWTADRAKIMQISQTDEGWDQAYDIDNQFA